MRLWIDTKRGIQVKATIKQQADDIKKEISSQMLSRALKNTPFLIKFYRE